VVSEGADHTQTLERLLDNDGAALVSIRGGLLGPPPLGPDNPEFPPPVAYVNRIAGRRYGHRGEFRTKLTVEEVLEATRAPDELKFRVTTHRQKGTDDLTVSDAPLPRYPELARRAGISGEVTVTVTVQAGKVTSTQALSGDRLLAEQAIAEIAEWQFPSDLSTSFTIFFVYRLDLRPTGASAAPRLELQLPWLVRITAPREGW
jgi:TonB family protein